MLDVFYPKVCLVSVVTVVLLYYYLNESYQAGLNIEEETFVNNEGCFMMPMDVMNTKIAAFTKWDWEFYKHHTINCSRHTWFRTEVVNSDWYLRLSRDLKTILKENGLVHVEQLACYWMNFRIIWSVPAVHFSRRSRFGLEFPYKLRVPKDTKQLRLMCVDATTNKSLYNDTFFFIQPPPGPLLRTPRPLQFWDENRRKAGRNASDPLISVMILGVESLSHLNFLRQMPKTAKYLRENMKHVEFWGLNKIGANTFSNLVTLLTGRSESRAKRNWSNKSNVPFIWKMFKKDGYNTSFGEDDVTHSMYWFEKLGFRGATTDHNMRDAMASMYTQRTPSSFKYTSCIGNRTFSDVLLEWIDRMLPHYQRYPFFSFHWWANGLIDYLNLPKLLDEKYERLLRRLDDSGITKNTIIFLVSDHGVRWGKFRPTLEGLIEDSQPLLAIMYPDWMPARYPLAMQNLQDNAHSLVTNYDIHATFKMLSNISSLADEVVRQKTQAVWNLTESQTPKAISLFLAIPPWRTCKTARIPLGFCLCEKQIPFPIDHQTIKDSAQVIIREINNMLTAYPVCVPVVLDSIVSAQVMDPDDNYIIKRLTRKNWTATRLFRRKNEAAYEDFIVRLKTKRSSACYEGLVRARDKNISMRGDVIRVDDGIKNKACTSNPKIEPFCYCKNSQVL
ncbi:hypothetical protein KR018_006797 [Drosophila ironensis]|nr:hypothetical protein KR018_006797 [Drosophila ironensis]